MEGTTYDTGEQIAEAIVKRIIIQEGRGGGSRSGTGARGHQETGETADGSKAESTSKDQDAISWKLLKLIKETLRDEQY